MPPPQAHGIRHRLQLLIQHRRILFPHAPKARAKSTQSQSVLKFTLYMDPRLVMASATAFSSCSSFAAFSVFSSLTR